MIKGRLAKGYSEGVDKVLQESLGLLELNPNDETSLCEIGKVYNIIGKPQEALVYANKALSVNPQNVNALNIMTKAFSIMNQLDKALACAKQAIFINQNDQTAHSNLHNLLDSQGMEGKAVEVLSQLYENVKGNYRVLASLGKILIELNEHQEAINYLKKSYLLNKKFLPNLINMTVVYNYLGNFSETEKVAREILKIAPYNPSAMISLSVVKKYGSVEDADIDVIKKIIANPETTDDEKAQLYFALGKIYNDCKAYDKAFDSYEAANKLKYELKKDENIVHYLDYVLSDKSNFVFSKEFFQERDGFGSKSEGPLFVLGCPRSGTTLVEQILLSHNKIGTVGEEIYSLHNVSDAVSNKYNGKRYPLCVNEMSIDDSIEIGKEYESLIRGYEKTGSDYIINKTPDNFCHIGFIKTIMPYSKVINCYRHPLDVCLSMYFNSFSGMIRDYYKLDSIVNYYKNYVKIMKIWDDIIPDFIHHVYYENLITNKVYITKELISFCGVEWEENCLKHDKNNNFIKTSSSWQARQPIYNSSMYRWKKYEKFIPQLIESLKDEVEDYESRLEQDRQRINKLEN